MHERSLQFPRQPGARDVEGCRRPRGEPRRYEEPREIQGQVSSELPAAQRRRGTRHDGVRRVETEEHVWPRIFRHRAVDVPDRRGRVDREDLAESQGRRPYRRGPRGPLTRKIHLRSSIPTPQAMIPPNAAPPKPRTPPNAAPPKTIVIVYPGAEEKIRKQYVYQTYLSSQEHDRLALVPG